MRQKLIFAVQNNCVFFIFILQIKYSSTLCFDSLLFLTNGNIIRVPCKIHLIKDRIKEKEKGTIKKNK